MGMRVWAAYLLSLAALAGCGEQPVERAAVHGRVTYRGEPIQDGTIVFSPIDRGENEPSESTGGKIADGAYALDGAKGPLVGAHRVEIQAYRKTGRQIPDMMGDVSKPNRAMVDEVVPLLPATFNVESTLKADIAPGDNTKDFQL
jgi:hypothetical protein